MEENLNIKIYGVTTIGPKGQIIIPKESREDLKMEVGSQNTLLVFKENVLGLCNGDCDEEELCREGEVYEIIGDIKIGTKFQFVIPCELRKRLDFNPGDNLIVVGESNKGVAFMKNDNIEILFEHLRKKLK